MELFSQSAANLYQAAQPLTAPSSTTVDQTSLTQKFTDVLRNGELAAEQAMVGDADSHTLVQSLAQAQLAIETVVAVRDKVVEAYQEILRMPV